MSTYYVVFERPEGDKLIHDGYNIDFKHDEPTTEELVKAYEDILGGTDKGTIIFMQKLHSEDPFAEVIDMGVPGFLPQILGEPIKEEPKDERDE